MRTFRGHLCGFRPSQPCHCKSDPLKQSGPELRLPRCPRMPRMRSIHVHPTRHGHGQSLSARLRPEKTMNVSADGHHGHTERAPRQVLVDVARERLRVLEEEPSWRPKSCSVSMGANRSVAGTPPQRLRARAGPWTAARPARRRLHPRASPTPARPPGSPQARQTAGRRRDAAGGCERAARRARPSRPCTAGRSRRGPRRSGRRR
mmetsp:Transcript_18474/g.53969  ORF Transcript_18474/g.53969 Transcript_18474/m.53969 type:complete len:205 (-) Transcript_18474:327-941(-)